MPGLNPRRGWATGVQSLAEIVAMESQVTLLKRRQHLCPLWWDDYRLYLKAVPRKVGTNLVSREIESCPKLNNWSSHFEEQ